MRRKMIVLGFVVAIVGFLFQISLQQVMKSYAIQGLYYQKYSSEDVMQSLAIEDLRDAPLQSLFNLHIHPPVLDTIRAILASIWATPDSYALLRKVDRSLFGLWAALHGILGALVFCWLSKTTRMGYAVLTALFFVAHPACILYATYPEGTLLTSVLILWAYYLLWNIRKNPQKSIALFAIAVMALFFTRSIFQWPSVIMFALSLILLGVSNRRVVIFLMVCGGLAGLYTGKQYYQFGIPYTSSFAGSNLKAAVCLPESEYFHCLEGPAIVEEREHSLPAVLIRRKKLTGAPNFNHVSYLRMNQRLINDYMHYLSITPLRQLAGIYLTNVRLYFEPSRGWMKHIIVDRIPWRDFYDRIFSFPVLPLLILSAGIVWAVNARRRDYRAGIALVLPGLYISLISVLFGGDDTMRYKFFLEPVFFVFIATQLYSIGEQIWRKVPTNRS